MKLEKGMYVRTKNLENLPSKIGKIINIKFNGDEVEYVSLDNEKSPNVVWSPENLKGTPSYNPIDLIEVGDYVDGCKVCEIREKGEISIDEEKVKEKCFCVNNNYHFKLYNNEIETIVTKEQFESQMYKI